MSIIPEKLWTRYVHVPALFVALLCAFTFGMGVRGFAQTSGPGIPDLTHPNTCLSIVTNFAPADGESKNELKVHVVDVNGDPVVGKEVSFDIKGSLFTRVTDANGDAFISFASTRAEDVSVSAKVDGKFLLCNNPRIVTFIPGDPDVSVATTYIAVVTTNAVANGTDRNRVKVHVTDANGNAATNRPVTFAILDGVGDPVGSFVVNTDANGEAFLELTSTVAGTVRIVASVNGKNIVNGSPASVVFVADVPSITPTSQTALSVVTTNAPANGAATNRVKAHVADANGNPVPNQTVTFSITNGNGTIVGTATVTTDANGDAFAEITSTVAGEVFLEATVNGTPIINGSPAKVTFVADVPDLSPAGGSFITVTADNAVANGTATNAVKAHVVDAQGNPVVNQAVEFAILDGTGHFVGSASVTTDANGDAVVSLTSTVAGSVRITASVNGNNIVNGSPATVKFVADTPDVSAGSGSNLSVVADNAIANGTAKNSVKAHVVDANGNPVPNQAVVFQISNGTGTIVGTGTVTTDANGDALVEITSGTVGEVSIVATVNGVSIVNGSPAKVKFITDVPDVSAGSNSHLSVVADNAIANGTAKNKVKAHVTDANGHPIAGQQVEFEIIDGNGVIVGSATVTTDADGDAFVEITSTTVGQVSLIAKVNGNPIVNGSPAKVKFIADVPDVSGTGGSNLSIVVNNAVANGTAKNSVKAHVEDAYGNPVANQEVKFIITSGDGTIVGTGTVVTDANGDAIVDITSTQVGEVSLIATVNGTPIVNGSPAKVKFVADVPDVSAGSSSNLSVVADNAIANGTAKNSVKAHVTDANGHPIAGQQVEFDIIDGSGNFVGSAVVTTDANGDAIVELTSTTVGEVSLVARVNGTPIVNGSPAKVKFVADVPDVSAGSSSWLSVVVDNAIANGTAKNSVKAHVADAYGNPVANQQVVFAIVGGTGTIVGSATVTTDANGDAVIEITSTVVGEVSLAATVNGVAIVTGSPAKVNFVTDVPDVSENGQSELTVVANNAVANGTSKNSVKAHVADANGHPIAGQQVEFEIEAGDGTIVGTATVITDANGDAVVEITSNKVGEVSLAAKVNGVSIEKGSPAKVKFVADVPDVSAGNGSYLVVVDNNAVANGTAKNSVKAHVVDIHGNPVANQQVVFNIIDGTGTFVGSATVTTDDNGDALAELTSTVVGDVVLEAEVNGAKIADGSPATVKFVADVPDVSGNGQSEITVEKTGAVADGTAKNRVKAHVEDAYGHPIVGQEVVFVIVSGDGTFVGTATVTTDANGDAVVELTSTTVGEVKLKATVNGIEIVKGSPATVRFVASPPDVSESGDTHLAVVKNFAYADGKATNSVKAHVVDALGNPVPDQTVVFDIYSGEADFVGSATVLTDANGDAVVELTSLVAGEVWVHGAVNGKDIVNGKPARVQFTSFPDAENPSTMLLVVTTNALANGVEKNSVKAHVVDASGAIMAGVPVMFSIKSGNAEIITPQPVLTNSDGDAIIHIISNTPGNVEFSATVEDKDIKNGNPATVRFVPLDIWVPKIFTPNGDGVNDIIRPIITAQFKFEHFTIYNRWGNIVFSTTDVNKGWDGRLKGVMQPNETYLWIIGGKDKDGKPVKRTGMFSLVK